jgi:hypothetical protein
VPDVCERWCGCRGGHVAFLQGLWPFGESWMDRAVTGFFRACHQRQDRLQKRRRGQPGPLARL